MSLQIFSKNLKYLRKKRGLTGSKFVQAVNKLVRREFKIADDKMINRKRLGAYEEGRSYCHAYLLPILCRVLGHKDALSLFTTDLQEKEKCETR